MFHNNMLLLLLPWISYISNEYVGLVQFLIHFLQVQELILVLNLEVHSKEADARYEWKAVFLHSNILPAGTLYYTSWLLLWKPVLSFNLS